MWGKPLGVAMQTKHIEFAVSAFRPDVIVTTHLVLGALIVAEKVDLPSSFSEVRVTCGLQKSG